MSVWLRWDPERPLTTYGTKLDGGQLLSVSFGHYWDEGVGMDRDLLGMLVLVGSGVGLVLAYAVHSQVAAGFEARKRAEQAAKERRWAAAFERLEGRGAECEPDAALPNPWAPLLKMCTGLLSAVAVAVAGVWLTVTWREDSARATLEAERAARWAAEDQQAAILARRADPEHQRRELALFGMRAAGLRVDLAAVKNVPNEAETMEVVATGINLNGHLCARVTAIRSREAALTFEADCVENRDGTGRRTYVIGASSGLALPISH